jgi:hypothetical protein
VVVSLTPYFARVPLHTLACGWWLRSPVVCHRSLPYSVGARLRSHHPVASHGGVATPLLRSFRRHTHVAQSCCEADREETFPQAFTPHTRTHINTSFFVTRGPSLIPCSWPTFLLIHSCPKRTFERGERNHPQTGLTTPAATRSRTDP